MIGLELKNDWFWVLTNIYGSKIGCWLVYTFMCVPDSSV
jgi:hypothetical protein